jgi:hypothetical protein
MDNNVSIVRIINPAEAGFIIQIDNNLVSVVSHQTHQDAQQVDKQVVDI